jgi:hypothetical protein
MNKGKKNKRVRDEDTKVIIFPERLNLSVC